MGVMISRNDNPSNTNAYYPSIPNVSTSDIYGNYNYTGVSAQKIKDVLDMWGNRSMRNVVNGIIRQERLNTGQYVDYYAKNSYPSASTYPENHSIWWTEKNRGKTTISLSDFDVRQIVLIGRTTSNLIAAQYEYFSNNNLNIGRYGGTNSNNQLATTTQISYGDFENKLLAWSDFIKLLET